MSGKRNISYVKPQDPSFLAQLKAQIGYKEGPTVETKRQKLDYNDSSDSEDRPEREEEKPQVVVLQSGDLTAEEASKEEERIAKEAVEVRADLNKPVVFKKRQDTERNSTRSTSTNSTIGCFQKVEANNKKARDTKNIKKHDSKSNKTKQRKDTNILSFNVEEEDEDNF